MLRAEKFLVVGFAGRFVGEPRVNDDLVVVDGKHFADRIRPGPTIISFQPSTSFKNVRISMEVAISMPSYGRRVLGRRSWLYL